MNKQLSLVCQINTASYNRDNAKGTFHQAEMVGKAQTNRMSAPGGEVGDDAKNWNRRKQWR